jgi:hypothetical protein
MPRQQRYVLDSDSEEYSETDVSYDSPRRRTTVKRRSFSRRRQSPDSNTYLSPGTVNVSHIRRSNSTGGHRRVQDPMVVVDVHNDVRNRQESRDRHDRHLLAEDDIEEIDIIRSHRRPRAASNLSVSRTPSPRQRDWELMMDQRILAKNDVRQDLELAKQQQEIERLERQIARAKEKRREEHRSTRYIEEDYWEEDLSERLRKLDRLGRRTSREEDVKRMARDQHLKELEKKEHASAERERIRKELELEAARKELEAEARKKEMAKLKDKAVEEWQRAQEAKKMKEVEEKAKKDKEFRERLKADFGYTDEQVDALLKKEKKEGKNHGQLVVLEPEKATYIKVRNRTPPPRGP